MLVYEDECVGCPPHMGCLGSACPNRNVPRFYCDECRDEIYDGELFEDGEHHYCMDCAKKLFPDEFEEDEDEG